MEIVRQIIPSIFSATKSLETSLLIAMKGKLEEKTTICQEFTRNQVMANATSNWLIVDELVLDLGTFIYAHPGGSEVLLEFMGLDATAAFNDVGHGEMARSILRRYVIGVIKEEEKSYDNRSRESVQIISNDK